MKQTTVNEFKDGLNLDLHPIVTPKTVLTDNINGTFITYNGNEFCLQNDRGNKKVASLTDGYTPIGIKEYNGILYIVSVNKNLTEIGTYPSPVYPETWTNDCFENTYDLEESYKPLMVLEGRTPFTNVPFEYDVNHPVTIEIQDSYDGSVNLILVADGCKTRIINSGFSVLPDNKCKFLSRRQSVETNVYDEDVVKDTELIRTNDKITNIDLYHLDPVKPGGQLKGGNYTFYIKFGDADYNQTDVVAESGIVSIFNGTDGVPSTISGTLLDERTDKMVGLTITGLNHVYSKIFVYYSREYSDTLGYRMTEYGMFNEPIDMVEDGNIQNIWLTGFEQIVPIDSEELNVDYHSVDWARAEAQNSNMLFLGNIGWNETFQLYKTLEEFTINNENVKVEPLLGELDENEITDGFTNNKKLYYSTKNICNKLGYWPNEYYRFGIVYILNDGSTTPVFNMHGNVSNNDKGVFKTPDFDVLNTKRPIGFKFTLSNISKLKESDKVIGWFVVRQKRIPTTICQALAIGTDKRCHLPMIWDNNGDNWYIESFLSLDRSKNSYFEGGEAWLEVDNKVAQKPEEKHILRPYLEIFDSDNIIRPDNKNNQAPYHKFDYRFIREDNNSVNRNALLSLDPCVNSSISGMFDGSKFRLKKEYDMGCIRNGIVFDYDLINKTNSVTNNCNTVFVQENTKSKVLDDNSIFSNVAGTGTSAGDFEYTKIPYGIVAWDGRVWWYRPKRYGVDDRVKDVYGVSDYYGYNSTHNVNLVRGVFTPYIGVDKNLNVGLYSIQINPGDALTIRSLDNSEYYCVSKRIPIATNNVEVYRGDCYICKVGIRMLHNFIDNTAPVTNTIVDPLNWERFVRQKSLYGGDGKDKTNGGNDIDHKVDIVDYSEVNLSDLNAVDLGYWVTFPCLSSYNLGLRCLDTSHVDEMALLGSPRSFYPLSGAVASNKVGDSYLLNDGLSATVGRKRYNIMPDVPYSKSEFANRIMFSNVHITDAFTNGYRTFQGLSYKDYDKQYGAITKLISLGQNIFIVMEHGLGLVPVNPKALMQTTTGEAIHIYGHGVLPDEMTIISQDYGSKYEHSVIRTPIGIYGMDVDARKIWRFSDKQGFETISDMKIETFLNDYLKEVPVKVGIKDVRAHYNGKKGDVMFTFYDENDLVKNIGTVNYFDIKNRQFTVTIGETKRIKCNTNLDDSEVEFNNSDNIECSYSDRTLRIKGLEEGSGTININGILLNIEVIPKDETSMDNADDIEIDDYYPDESWYVPSSSEGKQIYFNVRQIDTLYGMRFSLPAFLKCPNGRPITPNSNAAAYSIDKIVSVESEDESIIKLPAANHVAETTLYEQCDNYTLPTVVHVSEPRFKNTGTVGIRIYNKDKTEYDTCVVNVLNTNPEGDNPSQFEYKNLVWPFNIYVEQDSYFDVWMHHHSKHYQVITIDDPTAIWRVEGGYTLQDKVRTEETNVHLLYSSVQFKTGNKPGTYHITFTCPNSKYSGTYTVTVHVL